MNIGFDAKRLFLNYTGLGNYSRTLVSNLQKYFPEHQYFLYTPKAVRNKDTERFFDSSKFTIRESKSFFKSYWRSFSIIKNLKKDDIDVYHGLSAELPYGIQKTGIKTVVTIHDLIFKVLKNDYPFFDRFIYDRKTAYACKNADQIIAISHFTKNDIIKTYKTNPDKIHVIHLPVSNHFIKKHNTEELKRIKSKFNLPDRFFLYVGSIIKRKNLKIIIDAMHKINKSRLIPLVVVGNGKKYSEDIKESIHKYSLEDKVLFLTNISNEDLPKIYQLSEFCVFPSYYEGFGIPALEAIQSEKPVLVSQGTSLEEVVGDCGQVLPFDDSNAWANAIEKMIVNNKIYKQDCNDYLQKYEPYFISKKILDIYNTP